MQQHSKALRVEMTNKLGVAGVRAQVRIARVLEPNPNQRGNPVQRQGVSAGLHSPVRMRPRPARRSCGDDLYIGEGDLGKQFLLWGIGTKRRKQECALHLGVTEARHQSAQSSRMRMRKDVIRSKTKRYKPAPCRISLGSPI